MVTTGQLRPCIVKGKKALFHTWGNAAIINGFGKFKGNITIGIIEQEDGCVITTSPKSIKFIDNKINEYCFIDK